MQLSHLHYAVEIDIRSLYRSADHTKLIRQIWALGIRDKKLIYIIRRALEAPLQMSNGTAEKSKSGVIQTGLLAPLLSNIVLNELDHWIESQWQCHPITEQYPVQKNRNGSLNRGTGYTAMRDTR